MQRACLAGFLSFFFLKIVESDDMLQHDCGLMYVLYCTVKMGLGFPFLVRRCDVEYVCSVRDCTTYHSSECVQYSRSLRVFLGLDSKPENKK